MALNIQIFTDKNIEYGEYIISNSCLVDCVNHKAYSYTTKSKITEELLNYWSKFPHVVEILYSINHDKKFLVQLNLDVFAKEYRWGDLEVDLSLLDSKKREQVSGLKKFFIKKDRGPNFFVIHEDRNSMLQTEIKLEYSNGYVATDFFTKVIYSHLKEAKENDIQDEDIVLEGENRYVVNGKIIHNDSPTHNPWQKKDVEKINAEIYGYYKLWGNILCFNKLEIVMNILKWGMDNRGEIIELNDNICEIKGNWSEENTPENIDSVVLVENSYVSFDMEKLINTEEYTKALSIKSVDDVSTLSEWINRAYYDIISNLSVNGSWLEKTKFSGDSIRGVVSKNNRFRSGNKYYVYINYNGSKTQIDRQEIALRDFTHSNIPIIHLNSLLTKNESPTLKIYDRKSLSKDTLKSIYYDKNSMQIKHKPNNSQEMAIKIAINTQDLTIIQGPPGTGKTTVAKTITQRLGEVYGDNKEQKLLLTSYQKVAVDNIAEKINYGGFPVLRDITEDEKKSGQLLPLTVKDWRDNKVQLLEGKLVNKIDLSVRDYLIVDTMNHVELFYNNPEKFRIIVLEEGDGIKYNGEYLISYLLKLQQLLYQDSFDSELISKVESLINDFITLVNNSVIVEKIISKKRDSLEPLFDLEFKTILDNYFNRLNKIEDLENVEYSVDFYIKSRMKVKNILNKELENLLAEIRDTSENIKISRMSREDILSNFITKLKNDENSIMDGLNKWALVYASTLQRIEKLEDQYKVNFHSIIIDEAGRSNPLDMLIAMTKATKRIILLGDQNQLPPFIEDKIEALVEKGAQQENIGFLKDSFFEQLYNMFSEDRKRTSFLNEQYRYKGDSGNIISKIFYSNKLKSPLPDSTFKTIKGFKHSMEWIDIRSSSLDKSKKNSSESWYRNSEVQVIKKLVEKISKENPDLSIGIITPYSGQKEKIIDAINNRSIKVGTIDSFQGREFDVVLLSVVRTINDKGFKLGHLESRNRLCVAFSRHKSLLVIIGERNLVKNRKRSKRVEVLGEISRRVEDLCIN